MSATRSISVASRPTPIICIWSTSYMTLPPVPEAFHWTRETWGSALTCPPLGETAQHLFTTRQLELLSRESWKKLAPSAGVAPDRFITLNQVHGRRVITIPRGID